MDANKPRPNLLDVARHAGVSPATVSRVLNNTAPVRASVRARVLDSLTALGYKPPARSPAPTFPSAVALLIADILNPFFADIARGVQDEASVDGFLPLLLDTGEDVQREQQLLRMLAEQPVSGIIISGSRLAPQDLDSLLNRHSTPMVVLNRRIAHPNVSCILVDFEKAVYLAARHLLNLNHTRIAYLSGPKSEQSQTRRRGVELALMEAGLSLRPELCPTGFPNVDGGFESMSALLALPRDDRPTAVIAYNDMMALGVLHAIRAHNLRVPEDISVVGIDDIAMAAHANPPLTTVAQPKYRMGRLAMQMLRRMIQGHQPPEEGYTLMESPLVVRETTGPARANNSSSQASGSNRGAVHG